MPVYVHIPPELLCLLDVRRDVMKSMYLLPSMMYRIESFMLSSQLRAEINGHAGNFKISSSLVCSIKFRFVENILNYFCVYYGNLICLLSLSVRF